mmetsp:Transcript_6088/g.11221  ORF Transcript_6088/g.11221 Transcript_6088/m.11221 type:complete len:356 (+) Transcript_6088:170-1237(+)|eukprot:CAMPEP_0197528472 /NCGR_PEP_ID=MMETSP1318-20131121/25218_1 /TAXON_ID=552666 /ORGANISM="Partenskyella glossopodia, Strain RCC365" /LENGTH=355 /DNA_ID=CAMNT_0043083593 /DNA_START=137 /DNA_END=1204 /DNA_ORIENTATION=-
MKKRNLATATTSSGGSSVSSGGFSVVRHLKPTNLFRIVRNQWNSLPKSTTFMVGFLLGMLMVAVALSLKKRTYSPPVTPHEMKHQNIQDNSVIEYVQNKWKNCKDLVMVAGHSVYVGHDFQDADEANSAWTLLTYQKNQLSAFINHIKAGVEIAAKNPMALLVFSGGETRIQAGPRSEAASYWWTADAHAWFGHGDLVRHRAVTEEYARDSFENLMFSICRFRQIVGRYPETVTVVSFNFKEKRFVAMHRKALKWPAEKFHYVGVDMDTTPLPKSVFKAEQKNSIAHFTNDPYGCTGLLLKKKGQRNAFRREIPYPKGCPEMATLFTHCGTQIYDGRVPWDDDGKMYNEDNYRAS